MIYLVNVQYYFEYMHNIIDIKYLASFQNCNKHIKVVPEIQNDTYFLNFSTRKQNIIKFIINIYIYIWLIKMVLYSFELYYIYYRTNITCKTYHIN